MRNYDKLHESMSAIIRMKQQQKAMEETATHLQKEIVELEREIWREEYRYQKFLAEEVAE